MSGRDELTIGEAWQGGLGLSVRWQRQVFAQRCSAFACGCSFLDVAGGVGFAVDSLGVVEPGSDFADVGCGDEEGGENVLGCAPPDASAFG